ncbi:uncharacterized protein [Cicer arietinum]|uniref:Uncharacterized protein LOC101509356 n=1 Tax=Cicer arietinum TaxID=3827 RepID=A0A1S2YVS5_CICAR|nr:uncharacterized protein LOC101509356 [Cicer arietinum]
MDHQKWWQVKSLFVSLMFLSSLVKGSKSYEDHESLENFLCKQVNKEIVKPRTGVFYNISLPSNYTGIKVRVVRLRAASFFVRGVSFSLFNIPPHVVPQPNRKRMTILYENLGNWSSHYYNVPNYKMLTPVFGFTAYTSSESAFLDDNEKMNFIIEGNPIKIRFSHVGLHAKNDTPICVKFSDDGSVEFKNMTKPYVCEAYSTGHYTLVVPSHKEKSENQRFNKGLVLGFVIGFVGLVVLVLVLVALVKAADRKRIRKFERNSEGGEPFDTFWIGETKLPLASMIRTQPVLENDDFAHY